MNKKVREVIARELVLVAKDLVAKRPNALELKNYESDDEIAIDIEYGLRSVRYLESADSGLWGLRMLRFSVLVDKPKNALYEYTGDGYIYVGVEKGKSGVMVKVSGDVPFDEYEIDEEGRTYDVSSGGISIKGRKMFRLTDRAVDIVKWIDKVVRKDVGRDLVASVKASKNLVGGAGIPYPDILIDFVIPKTDKRLRKMEQIAKKFDGVTGKIDHRWSNGDVRYEFRIINDKRIGDFKGFLRELDKLGLDYSW